MKRELTGRVAIVALEWADLARRLAAEGAIVVVVGDDAEAAGTLLAQIEADAGAAGGGRLAYFRTSGAATAPPAVSAPPAPSAPAPHPSPGAPVEAAVAGRPWSGPTGSDLDALVELVAEMWPAR
jgi:NAD(P)-dependent dehydrogenase (short-subunit alcohol dehydrogenase family)